MASRPVPGFGSQRPLSKEEKDWLKVQTELAQVELDDAKVVQSHDRKLRGLEVRQETADAEAAELATKTAQMVYDKDVEHDQERKASNKYQRIYVFDDPVSEQSVNGCIATLDVWRRVAPKCDVTLRLFSPGGEVIAGMYLFDYLRGMQRDGHHITTEAYGYAASMAGILLQVGDVRRVGRESYILIHQIAFGVRGKVGEVEDEVKFVNMIANRVLSIFADAAERAGTNGTASHPLSRAQFKNRWERKDWWVPSPDALKWGIVDEVI